MTTLTDIEQKTKRYAAARAALAEIVRDLNDKIEQLKRQRMRVIASRADEVANEHAALKAEIEAAPELFTKPRTVVFHGVKVGMQKGKGGIEWDDEARVVELIERHMPELFETLVQVTRRPIKKALQNLTGSQLKKIAVRLIDDSDQVVISSNDTEVDKMVSMLIKTATEDLAAEGAQ